MPVIKIENKLYRKIRKLVNKSNGYRDSIEHLSEKIGEVRGEIWVVTQFDENRPFAL